MLSSVMPAKTKKHLPALSRSVLRARGIRVWFDAFTLTVGDSLRRSIDDGLAKSRYGIVVVSPSFLQKQWPQRELDGLVARESAGVKVILPVLAPSGGPTRYATTPRLLPTSWPFQRTRAWTT